VTAPRALVTGAGGFVGRWLCRELVHAGWHVVGSTLGDAAQDALPEVEWRAEDLTEAGVAERVVDAARPDAVFHLAGLAFVLEAGRFPERGLAVNVGSALHLLTALRSRRASGVIDPTMIVVGSAEQYGRHELPAMPLTEDTACHPRNTYAATKAAQEIFALEAYRSSGLRVITTRSFNHSGPGQSPAFLLPVLVQRVMALRASGGDTLSVGNTDTVRDFLHVRDVARAYLALVARGVPGEVYNVCSGDGVRVRDLVDEVCRAAGVSPMVVPDPALQRPADIPVLVGSNDKLRAHTGWAPVLSRADIITDLLNAASH
jgi:GDP-4-dehydro-6-deoxy-D-mannose reductase